MRLFYLVLLFVWIGFYQVNGQNKSYDTTARYFIIQASIGNLQEVELGQIAENKASNPEVIAFAKQMISDHNNAETKLMELIKIRGFQIPPEATDKPVKDLRLENTPSKDFDKTYVHMMIPDHRQTIQLFENYALTGKDPDVRSYAKQTLPVLKEHLASIMAINDKVKGAAQ